MTLVPVLRLLASFIVSAGSSPAVPYDVLHTKYLSIRSFDGTLLRADISYPTPKSSDERFPVLVLANSWSVPQIEYFVDAQKFSEAGYIVLEYEARGWYTSGGQIDVAGPKDQRDTSEVISYVLNQTQWQPDPEKIALGGISYGAGLALLGAVNDQRVKAVVSMSGWAFLERALFEYSSPNLVWGDLLVALGHVVGHPEPLLDEMYHQVLIGNESAFRDFANNRSFGFSASALEARGVPLFLSNNLEDRLFHPQDMLDFFQTYKGPKRLLLNQGIHATAEIGGLIHPNANFVWIEVRKWLDHYLMGAEMPAPPLIELQLRSNKKERVTFDSWPTDRLLRTRYAIGPRGVGFHGTLALISNSSANLSQPEAITQESITYSVKTGIYSGFPVVGTVLQVFIDKRIKSSLLLSSRAHALWYYVDVPRTRFCGTPRLNLDITATQAKWQLVAYLFGVDRETKEGTLITHGSLTCWNCTSNERQTRQFELRTLCEDLGGFEMGGLSLALTMHSDLYQPASTAKDLKMIIHYSSNFSLEMPVVDRSTAEPANPWPELIV